MSSYYEHEIRRTVTVELSDIEGEELDKLLEYLSAKLPKDCDCDLSRSTEDGSATLEIVESGTEQVWPGVRTFSNGDPGYPDEYEDDLELYEEDVRDMLSKYEDENNFYFGYELDTVDEPLD